MTIITPAGYIVCSNESIISTGDTAQAALDNFVEYMRECGATVVDDVNGEEVTNEMIEEGYEYIHASNYPIQSASAALIAAFYSDGGDIGWGAVGGIACTCAERDEA